MLTVPSRSLDYSGLKKTFEDGRLDETQLGEALSDEWAATYRARASPGEDPELVEVDQGELTYLFDLTPARGLGVYGAVAHRSTQHVRQRGCAAFRCRLAGRGLYAATLSLTRSAGEPTFNLISQSAALNLSGRGAGWSEPRRRILVALSQSRRATTTRARLRRS